MHVTSPTAMDLELLPRSLPGSVGDVRRAAMGVRLVGEQK